MSRPRSTDFAIAIAKSDGAKVAIATVAQSCINAACGEISRPGVIGHSDLRMAQRYIAHLGDDGARIAVALDSYGSAPGRDTGDTNSGPKES